MEIQQKKILDKYRISSAFPDEVKNNEYVEEDKQKELLPRETDIVVGKLPVESILAEKRRRYTAKEEFIYLLYNDILPAFIIEWNEYIPQKDSLARKLNKDNEDIKTIEDSEAIDTHRNDDACNDEKTLKENNTPAVSWKLSLPDEFADITFYNNNSYRGYISRKMMEGNGEYRWHNGVHYKGQFQQNQIEGRGYLEWNNDCWYEGDFLDGFRHGKGIMADREHNRVYIGQWYMGCKHRKE